MGKLKCKLDKNWKYKLETVLDIIMTSDYSNTSISSDNDIYIDTTFNNNSSDSEDNNEGNEIIRPSPKQRRKYSTKKNTINQPCSNPRSSREDENANNVETGMRGWFDVEFLSDQVLHRGGGDLYWSCSWVVELGCICGPSGVNCTWVVPGVGGWFCGGWG